MTIYNWVEFTLNNASQLPASIHFDEIDTIGRVDGTNALSVARTVICEAEKSLEKMDEKDRKPAEIFPVVYLPVGMGTNDILLWNEGLWGEIGTSEEPPSLFVLPEKRLFDDAWECYYRPLVVGQADSDVSVIYRSCRTFEELRRGISEFDNGIYVFRAGS